MYLKAFPSKAVLVHSFFKRQFNLNSFLILSDYEKFSEHVCVLSVEKVIFMFRI